MKSGARASPGGLAGDGNHGEYPFVAGWCDCQKAR
jgi:hypothetical protein